MPRYRLRIEYDGTPYVGWQRQDNGPSVQGAIEAAILSLTGETVSIRGAGRTDSGVHAMGQVAHADLVDAGPLARLAAASGRVEREVTLSEAPCLRVGRCGEEVPDVVERPGVGRGVRAGRAADRVRVDLCSTPLDGERHESGSTR